MVRKKTRELLNGYLDLPQFTTNDGLGRYIFEIVWVDRAVLVGKFDLALGAMKKDRKTETMTRKEVTVAMVKVSVVIMPHKWRKEVWMRFWVQGRRRTKQTKYILVVHS